MVQALLVCAWLSGAMVVESSIDREEVERLVLQLSDPSRAARLSARDHLLKLGPDAAALLRTCQPASEYESRTWFEYVLRQLPRRPSSIQIQGGTYRIGNNEFEDSSPERDQAVAAFRIDDTEVTCFEYYEYLRESGAAPPPHWRRGRYPYGQESFPMRQVSFLEAGGMAAWAGGRLPTCEEWEIAALLGERGPFPWGRPPRGGGSLLAARLNPVASTSADRTQSGCFDMASSVAEWVTMEDGGAASRGGHYLCQGHPYLRLTRKAVALSPEARYEFLGFRIADRR